jgi:uncharacterized protein
MALKEFPRRKTRMSRIWIFAVIFVLLLGARTITSYIIDYQWWKSVGQIETWITMLTYGTVPVLAATLLVFALLWTTHARALKFAGTGLGFYPVYAKLSSLALLLLSWIISAAALDNWTIVRYFGGRSLAADPNTFRDPVFGHPLAFYFFELPFYSDLLTLVTAVSFFALVIYWVAGRGWQLRHRLNEFREGTLAIDIEMLGLSGAMESIFLRSAATLLLLAIAARVFLSRYNLLLDDHHFMVGVDYVDQNIELPLRWVTMGACVAAAALLWLRRPVLGFSLLGLGLLQVVVPAIVSGVYVKPNEISIEKPYIKEHINATRSAYSLEKRVAETQFPAQLEAKVDVARHRVALDDVRLWDWRAFHDTVTQLQALRQYYVFHDTDVDRYEIGGQLQQVMLTPRELDVRQLASANANWINPHFIYTHGYGLVMADATHISQGGTPQFYIQDAPPKVNTKDLKLTRPELYYSEVTHEPVFVHTKQPEFNYPAGAENVHVQYEGNGGIPISSLAMRLTAAVYYGDWNILLTNYLGEESRMLIRRNIKERLESLASFLSWDADPYLVLTDDGRLVWMVDGYTTSAEHPYSKLMYVDGLGTFNYIRNSVKATIDAYDGHVTLYVFDQNDPLIRAWQAIFPNLFRPAAEMPADLRRHARYPEMFFTAQAQIYRTFHMQNPESFYNNEDLWDVAKNIYGQDSKPEPLQPTFVVATLPGEQKPEFLLMQSFTPRNKDNLIGVMMARCDGEHLGEVQVLQLSKQNLMYGPLQIESKIDSDQNISKDLSLWNQQGSSVLRGQMLVLPVDNTFLYIEPLFLQSSQTRMPQMKRVVIAMGNTLIYRDTYEQALSDLTALSSGSALAAPATTTTETATPSSGTTSAAAPSNSTDTRIQEVRRHFQRYRELAGQGKMVEAGKELEAIQELVGR